MDNIKDILVWVFLLVSGIIMIVKPMFVWKVDHFLSVKDGEPTELYIQLTRLFGGICIVVAVIGGIILLTSSNDENSQSHINQEVTNMDNTSNNQINTYTQISMDKAVSMMEDNTDYIILDVRTAEEFAEKHIPDAINIPNETIGDTEIEELPDKNQLIFVYCRSGNRSKQASDKLVKLGYTNVYEFGGIIDWTGETVSK